VFYTILIAARYPDSPIHC